MSYQTEPVFHELLDELRALERRMLDHQNALHDEQYVVETYKWIFSITQVAFDCFVWADPARPRFVDIVGPYKKWGGDNADAFYQYAPIDPARTYRVTGRLGDSVYLSVTVYGGPDDGRYSERIVGTVNDRTLAEGGALADDGTFTFWISPEPQDGVTLLLAPDAVCAITRDYLADAAHERRADFTIEAVDPPATWRESDERLARGMRAALTWVRDQAGIVPLGLGEPNHVDDPYPVPSATFGWAAGDAAYAMGSFALDGGEALVLRGTSPPCVFWNLCLWNPYLHTYNYDYDRVTVNGRQVVHEADGSWTIVVADADPGHPNWIATQGHDRGRLWFRWFLPEHTPAPVAAEVVPIAEVVERVGVPTGEVAR